MFLENPFFILPGAIDDKDCDRIVSVGSLQPRGKGVVGLDGKTGDVRDSGACFFREPWVDELIYPYLDHANRAQDWNFDLRRMEVLQFGEYGAGQYYGWHSDAWPGTWTAESTPDESLAGLARKLSISVQLSDPGTYEGGNLEMELPGLPGERDLVSGEALRARGTVVIFPSFVYHQVTEVTEGTRYSLVGWVCGPPFC